MLSYNKFEKVIDTIQKYYKKDDQLTELLEVEGFICYSGNIVDTLVDLLETVMEDVENQWISYWIWDCSFGTDAVDKIFVDDYPIPFTTIKDLYCFLLKGRKTEDI